MNICIETYGCSANQNNGEIMAGLLSRSGFIIVNNPNIADIIILNSCIVKGPTLQRMLSRINELKKHKCFIVAGCMPDVMARRILSMAPKAALVGSHHVNEIVNVVKSLIDNKPLHLISKQKETHLCSPKNYKNKFIGITQISEGCLGDCAYCIVRLVKGNLNSYPESEILKNVKSDLMSGCKEIWITSQDCAAFGLDRPSSKGKSRLPDIINKILKLKGKFLIRIGMSNPNHILPVLPELIESFKDKKVFKFLHIPLQSGSDKVLREMNRKYSVSDFKKIINAFRKEIPEITVSTDIIVGFPGETKKEFDETLKLMKDTKPNIINISRYWPMPGTKASQMELIPQKEIMKRTAELMALHKETAINLNKKWISKETKVLVDENKGDGLLIARNECYKPIIIRGDKTLLGKHVNVRITDASSHYLFGDLLNEISGC